MTNLQKNNVYDITERFAKKAEEAKPEVPPVKEKLTLSDWAVIIFLCYLGFAGVFAQW